MHKKSKYIDATNLSLFEWLEPVLKNPEDRGFTIIDYQFPTEELKDEYLSTIQERDEHDLKSLLRNFLILGGNLGSDDHLRFFWRQHPEYFAEDLVETEFAKRAINPKRNIWEGNTWILDLLPSHPLYALNVINSYIISHNPYIPDGRVIGFSDAACIVRSRYCEYIHPKDFLCDLTPRDFEYLVAYLYERIGYATIVTSAARDGGYDIYCTSNRSGLKETILIECKKYNHKTGVKQIREFSGVVESMRANRGVFISTNYFTKDAIKYADINRIELIAWNELNLLMNQHLGQSYIHNIDFFINMKKRDIDKQTSVNQSNKYIASGSIRTR